MTRRVTKKELRELRNDVDIAEECRNLKQLSAMIDRLIL